MNILTRIIQVRRSNNFNYTILSIRDGNRVALKCGQLNADGYVLVRHCKGISTVYRLQFTTVELYSRHFIAPVRIDREANINATHFLGYNVYRAIGIISADGVIRAESHNNINI